ncbi:MAG: hypothetical protein OXH19_11680 [Chloroflexi bacterium]|nr:hypothetical protein [Chloroflexota bacterium]
MSDGSDRLERDVEEVLSNIEDFDWRRRQSRRPGPIRLAIQRFGSAVVGKAPALTANHLLLLGAALLIIGLVLRGGGLWLAVVGIVVFVIGLFWTSRGGNRQAGQPRGGYWRDRYISYEQSKQSPLKRFFRRNR